MLIVGVCRATSKHSLVLFVWSTSLYVELPPYSARQQYRPPVDVAVVAEDVATPLLRATALPIWVPLLGQPLAVTSVGPHRKNVTDPVTVPSVPVKVAVSVTDTPGA